MQKNTTPAQQPHASAARKPRADALRNRERLLLVAREAFAAHGPNASMDDIARRAGVGPGTLYRHFSTRDALIEAVFRNQVEHLTAAAHRLASTLEPLDALHAWMLEFIEYVVRKLLILPAMDAVPGGSARLIEGTRGTIHATFHQLAQRAIQNGDLRPDTDPEDLLRAFIGVFHTASTPGWEQSARRIVTILLNGSRPAPSGTLPPVQRGS